MSLIKGTLAVVLGLAVGALGFVSLAYWHQSLVYASVFALTYRACCGALTLRIANFVAVQ